jgi:hypothetical protein
MLDVGARHLYRFLILTINIRVLTIGVGSLGPTIGRDMVEYMLD